MRFQSLEKMKTKNSLPLILFLVSLIIFTIFYWKETPDVPFHPDESTYLFTSGNFELFWQQPSAIYWKTEMSNDILQRYRLLDAPLLNYLIGLSRWIAGKAPLSVDWDWSKSWDENDQAGAFPSPDLLLTGRMASAIVFPFSVFFLYLVARKSSSELTGWLAAILLASNSLILLHTRRAMAEGPLLFTITLSLWGLTYLEKHPVWISIPTALAFCAKQSLAALSPVGLLAVLWQEGAIAQKKYKSIVFQFLLYSSLSLLLIGLAYSFLWGDPIRAGMAALQARQDLASRQVADRPEQTLDSIPRKLAGMIANLYIVLPQFSETANYQDATRLSEEIYLSNPFHQLFRSIPGGVIIIFLNLFGFLMAVYSAIKEIGRRRRQLVLLLLANLFQMTILFFMIPFPWQRYYMPLVPFVCLWTAYGINKLKQDLWKVVITRLHIPTTQ